VEPDYLEYLRARAASIADAAIIVVVAALVGWAALAQRTAGAATQPPQAVTMKAPAGLHATARFGLDRCDEGESFDRDSACEDAGRE
jgi:hypothetical protein